MGNPKGFDILKQQAKIGVIVVKPGPNSRTEDVESAGKDPEPLIYPNREEHNRFIERMFATLR